MDDVSTDRDEAHEPAPTWGSTVNVARGTSSVQYNTQPTQVVNRVLQMQTSPAFTNHIRQREAAVETSSPVEEFSSPAKPSQFTESDSVISQAPISARVGTWELPDGVERASAEIEIDPNGDDDVVRAQVASIFAQERAEKRKRREEQALSSSYPSQGTTAATEMISARVPRASTPPLPPMKRARRGQQDVAVRSQEPEVPSASRTQRDVEVDFSTMASPAAILSDPTNEASRQSISQYVKASPLVPDFLKDEIKRYLDRSVQHSQSQGSSNSDSDTQEDGYLKTKPFWLFEMLRVEVNGSTIVGRSLTSEINRGSLTMVLQIYSGTFTFSIEFLEREELIMSRNEARSNPWFDGNGHPFNIIYRSSANSKSASSSNGISSVVTQPSAEQWSQMQSRLSQLSDEKEAAWREKVEAERKLEAMLASYQATQEDNDFLRRQYGDASTMAADLARGNDLLTEETAALKTKLSQGMSTVKGFSEARIGALREQLKVSQMQLDILLKQNRLTNDAIREKAGKWDAYQAKEQIRLREMERKRAEIDALRAASYQAMEQEDLQRIADLRKKPHELFLEVDLDKEKRSLPGHHTVVADEEEDEVAMLRAEAEAATGQAIDLSAPRSRRSRSSRSATAAAATPLRIEPLRDMGNIIEEQSVQQSQLQALNEAAQMLQGEFEYQTQESGVQLE